MDELQFHPIKHQFHPNELQVRQEKLVFRLVGFRFLGGFFLSDVFESYADPSKRGGLGLEPSLGGGGVFVGPDEGRIVGRMNGPRICENAFRPSG